MPAAVVHSPVLEAGTTIGDAYTIVAFLVRLHNSLGSPTPLKTCANDLRLAEKFSLVEKFARVSAGFERTCFSIRTAPPPNPCTASNAQQESLKP